MADNCLRGFAAEIFIHTANILLIIVKRFIFYEMYGNAAEPSAGEPRPQTARDPVRKFDKFIEFRRGIFKIHPTAFVRLPPEVAELFDLIVFEEIHGLHNPFALADDVPGAAVFDIGEDAFFGLQQFT